jgi:zona occludens toxin
MVAKWFAEHGHVGQDILWMSQAFGEVHKSVRVRTSQRNLYHKLDAVGLEKKYNVKVLKATAPERFSKVSDRVGTYDPKYFGLYRSHVDDSINTGNFKDARAVITNTFLFRWGIPLAGGAAVWGAITIWGFFHPKPSVSALAGASSSVASAPRSASASSSAASAVPGAKKSYAGAMNEKFRPRLAMLWTPRAGPPVGIVEWWDGDTIRERLSFQQLVAMGETVTIVGNVARIADGWVTPWPVKSTGEVRSAAQVVPYDSVAR